jgi:8-oxo-dGTP pyrophosphatase MutT (NUDIX family)
MEVFDLYDSQFNKLQKKMIRGGTNQEGEYHLVVHIWFKNSKGQFLIQQRNKQEDSVPYQWAATGGAAIAGDSSIEAAIRETKEELGLTLRKDQLKLVKRYFIDHHISNYITDLYIVKEDILIEDLIIDTLEVRDVAYKTMSEIKEMIRKNEFWNYARLLERSDYFELLEKS